MNHPADRVSLFVVLDIVLSDACLCCHGGTETMDRVCSDCLAAIQERDRLGHPHRLSPEQRALARADPAGGEVHYEKELAPTA
jgi:predicted amidophosphoribosyltransferase